MEPQPGLPWSSGWVLPSKAHFQAHFLVPIPVGPHASLCFCAESTQVTAEAPSLPDWTGPHLPSLLMVVCVPDTQQVLGASLYSIRRLEVGPMCGSEWPHCRGST